MPAVGDDREIGSSKYMSLMLPGMSSNFRIFGNVLIEAMM
jgi:hypothetical protein